MFKENEDWDGADEVTNPTPGETYWVVTRRNEYEQCFSAMMTQAIGRDHHKEPEDRTPSYAFNNGVTLHGNGVRFYRQPPVVDEETKTFYEKLRRAFGGF